MDDTSPEQRRRYFELLRRATPAERLRVAERLTSEVRALALAGIRMQHPGCSDSEAKVRLAVRLYGRDVVERVLGNVPSDAR